jgi:hypothetical protein
MGSGQLTVGEYDESRGLILAGSRAPATGGTSDGRDGTSAGCRRQEFGSLPTQYEPMVN